MPTNRFIIAVNPDTAQHRSLTYESTSMPSAPPGPAPLAAASTCTPACSFPAPAVGRISSLTMSDRIDSFVHAVVPRRNL